jgi:hypothetical protein
MDVKKTGCCNELHPVKIKFNIWTSSTDHDQQDVTLVYKVLSKQNRKMHIKHLKLKSLVRYFAKHL